jgi:putative membrane protein
VREIFIRKNVVIKSWLNFLTIATCITISSLYEFLEWFVAIASGQSAESFLGTQGYVWDTQSDMLYATIGAITFLILLSKTHSQQINSLLNKNIS